MFQGAEGIRKVQNQGDGSSAMVQGIHLRNYIRYRVGRALTELSGGHSYTGGGCSCI